MARDLSRGGCALRLHPLHRHVDIDVVVPVPDSGVPAALGYSQHSGVPFELGIIRNHYVGRTFIQPTQSGREIGVRMKHAANRIAIEGKRILLIVGQTGQMVALNAKTGEIQKRIDMRTPSSRWPWVGWMKVRPT